MSAQRKLAGLAGLLYVLLAVFTGYTGGFVEPTVYVAGDAAATARSLVENAGAVRYGTFAALAGGVAWILLALALHALLHEAGRGSARALLVFTALGTGIMMLNAVLLLEAVRVATGSVDLSALGIAGRDAIALLLLDAQHYGGAASATFMGLWLIPLGSLAIRSRGLLPGWLGIPLIVGGAGYLFNVLAMLLMPGVAAAIHDFILWPATIAEVATIVCLFIHAAKAPATARRVPAAA